MNYVCDTITFEKKFQNFINSLIKLFCSYYGKEYENEFLYRIKSTNYIFYNKKSKPNIIYQSMDVKYPKEITKEINYLIKTSSQSFNAHYDFDKNELYKYIVLPVNVNDEIIIHETIHAAMYNPLYITEDYTYKGKCGLITPRHDGDLVGESFLEESITELEAKKLYKLFSKNKKQSFINPYDPNNDRCCYDVYIPLITSFYNYFFDEITYSRVNLDKNYLISIIGEDNYIDFINFIGYYHEDFYSLSKVRYIDLINNTVSKMKKDYKVKKLI